MIGSPFDAIHAHAWHDPMDVPSLNAGVSLYIRQCIEKLRQWRPNQTAGPNSTSLLLLGPAGSGKTHLFTRLRQQIGCRAVFVHTRPAIGVEPSPRHVLAAVMQSLQYPIFRHEERQIDVIVGTMLSRLGEGRPQFPLAFLDECRGQTKEAQKEIIECAIARAEDHFPEVCPRYLEQLLRVPFAERIEQRALWAWLSGGELSQVQLDRLGERAPLREDEVMAALRTLGAVAMFGAPIVFVFDQLENLVDDEGKTARISQYARLVSELRDTVPGLVIVQMALDAVWMSRVHPVLHASMRDRLEEHVESLALPTPEERLELIKGWMSALPSEVQGEPFPYPFTKEQIESWLHTRGMTPRMLMQACGEAYRSREMPKTEAESAESAEACPDERLDAIWLELLVEARKVIDQSSLQGQGITSESIRAGFMATLTISGMKSEATTIDGVPSMTFHSEGRDVLVIFAQQAHHRALAKTFKSAIEQAAQKRVVVLREQAFAIPPTWKEVNTLSSTLEKHPNAMWLLVDRESLARLLATERLLMSARSQDFTETDGNIIAFDTVVAWAQKNAAVVQSSSVPSILRSKSVASDGSRQESLPSEKQRMAEQPPAVHDGATARELRKLKVASIERLVREIRINHPVATRASVVSELARMKVRRFGGSIVALEDLWA